MFGLFRNHLKAARETQQKLEDIQSSEALTDAAYRMALSEQEILIKRLDELEMMLRICRDSRLAAESHNRDINKRLDAATFKLDSAIEAIKIFADRYKISAVELRQLQVADLLPAQEDNQGFERATASFAPFESGDALTLLNAGNDFKQTSGKFRQLRQNFVTLQLALTKMFDGLERAAKKKPVTISQLRDVRQQASDAIGRKV